MIKNIQALRALAAISVVFVHLDKLLPSVGLTPFGAQGVDLFFVISGFVMVNTTRRTRTTWGQFALNRLARIAPIYWLMTLCVFIVALLAPSLLGATRPDLMQLLKSILFIPFVKSDGLVQPVLFVGWTLNYEMFFYALFTIGLAFSSYRAGVAFVLLALAGLVVAGLSVGSKNTLFLFYTNSIVIEFALGVCVALLVPRTCDVRRGLKFAIAGVFLVALSLFYIAPFIWQDMPRVVVSGLPSVFVLGGAILLERCGWSASSPFVILVGDASYALYLSHPFVTQAFQKIGSAVHSAGALSLFLIATCLVTVVGVAILLHLWVERPLSGWSRRLLGTHRMPPPPSAKRPVQDGSRQFAATTD